MEDIIKGILSSDGSRVKNAETLLTETYKDPNCLYTLCQIMTTNSAVEVRQLATILMEKRIQPVTNWLKMSLELRRTVKGAIMQALVHEKERSVKNVIGGLVSSIIRHDSATTDNWLHDVIEYVFERCVVSDELECELASGTFATLACSAPNQFLDDIAVSCKLFATVLNNAEIKNKLISRTVSNMCVGITNLIPFALGDKEAENAINSAIPMLMKVANLSAQGNKIDEFNATFEVFDCIAEFVPKLINNVRSLISFGIGILSNLQCDKTIRIQMMAFIGILVQAKKSKILNSNLIMDITNVIFQMMCYTSDANDAEENELFTDGAVSAAMQALDDICNTFSHEEFLTPLLQLVEAAYQHPDPLRRRTAYLCMGIMSDSCSEIICEKYLEIMLNLVKIGINDLESIVRITAYYALARFMQYLQPDISKYSSDIFNIFYGFINQTIMDVRMGNPEPKNICRMFLALQEQCKNLKLEILPHLPKLMECLFETQNPINSSGLREPALMTIGTISAAAEVHMVTYLPRILNILRVYMVQECDIEMETMRSQAINTWSNIVRNVGEENIAPYTNDSVEFCLMILSRDPPDPDLRSAVYNLLGGLSEVLKENMSTVFPKIMDRMVLSVISHQDIAPAEGNDNDDSDNDDISNDNDEMFNDEDNFDENNFYNEIESDYAMEKQMAIDILREFSMTAGKAFAPYLKAVFDNVFKVVCHPREATRIAAIEAICEFVMAYHRLDNKIEVSRCCTIIVPKFVEMLRLDDSSSVVIQLLGDISNLFKELRGDLTPKLVYKDIIFISIKKLLLLKARCQWTGIFGGRGGASASDTGGDVEDNGDLEEDVIESTVELFNSFGYAVEASRYSIYFGKVIHILGQTLSDPKLSITDSRKNFILSSLSDSFKHLGSFVDNYFDAICPVFISATSDEDSLVRQNSYYGLGELMLHGEKKSLEYCPIIFSTLSDGICKETDPAVMDYICGAVSRILVDNHMLFDLTKVMPVFLSHLPLRTEFQENEIIVNTFHILYEKSRASIFKYLEKMLTIIIEILMHKQTIDPDTTKSAVEFVKMIRQEYPEEVQYICSLTPDMHNFVMSL